MPVSTSHRRPARQHLGPMLLVLFHLAIQPAVSTAGDRTFENDDQKYMYYWGTTFGEQLKAAGISDERDVQWMLQGLQDRLAGTAPEYGEEYPSLLSNYLVRRRSVRQFPPEESASRDPARPGYCLLARGDSYDARWGQGQDNLSGGAGLRSSRKPEHTGWRSSDVRGRTPDGGRLGGFYPPWMRPA